MMRESPLNNDLSVAYSYIAAVDLTTGIVDVLKPVSGKGRGKYAGAMDQDLQREQVMREVAEEYRETYLDFINMNTAAERLAGKGSLNCIFQRPDGKWTLSAIVPQNTDAQGNVTSVIIANRDITDLRNWEQEQKKSLEQVLSGTRELLEREKKNTEIISAISSIYWAIYVIDLQKDSYEEVNGGNVLSLLVGKNGRASELMKIGLENIIAKEEQSVMREFLNLQTLPRRMEKETTIVRDYRTRSGHWHMGRFIVKSRDARGQAEKVLYAVNVIDESKQRELNYQRKMQDSYEKMLDYQNRLIETAKEAEKANASKTDFLRRMSHDIRTPINGIRGMVQIADHHMDDPQKLRECSDKIWKSTDHLLSLVNDVLDMNKLESGKFTPKHEPFSLKQILDEIIVVAETQAQEMGIDFIYQDTRNVEHDRLIGSPVYVKRIIMNFTSNAIKYNRPGGSVKVYGKEISFDGRTAWYEFICEDTGIGMSEEFQKKAFEPFAQEEQAQARTQYGGTGLGLSISKSLAELLGGSIELHSVLGEGTRVVFRLPAEVDPAQHRESDTVDYSSIRIDGVKALLAEDNDLNAEIAVFMLEQHGIQVKWVENGQQAVEEIRENPDTYDVVFMDVMMPVMDGLAAAAAIRTNLQNQVPIFAMTANAFTDDAQRSLDAGMNEHLTKPLTEKDIVRALMKYVGREQSGR